MKWNACLLSAIIMVAILPPASAFSTGRAESPTVLSAGGGHSGLVTDDGSLWMWGINAFGCLGDGTSQNRDTPVKMMEDVAAMDLGLTTSAAIKKDGSLWMWGMNDTQQLGDGTTINRSRPVKVMEQVAAVSVGASHTAALKQDGSLWTWGDYHFGKLGIGPQGADPLDASKANHSPTKIMENVAAVSLGQYHSAAIQQDGSLWMWGYNAYGQIGDDTFENRNTPVKVMEHVTSVALGEIHTAAVTEDGSLWFWGGVPHEEGGGSENAGSCTPIKVMEGAASVALQPNRRFPTCAVIKTDGSLWTWGGTESAAWYDFFGPSRYAPVPALKILDNVSSVSLGWDQCLAVQNDGAVWVWGDNSSGQLGVGLAGGSGETIQNTPVRLTEYRAGVSTAGQTPCTVNLDLRGGAGATSLPCVKGAFLVPPVNPTREGCFFAGWFQDRGCTRPWNFDSDKVSGDCTLYAKWETSSAVSETAERIDQTILVCGKPISFQTYIRRDGAGNPINFVSLQDVAYVLTGTSLQFHVEWRNNAFRIQPGQPYVTQSKTPMSQSIEASAAVKSSGSPVLMNGTIVPLEGLFFLNQYQSGHHYFKLRDLADVVGFHVEWNSETSQISITVP